MAKVKFTPEIKSLVVNTSYTNFYWYVYDKNGCIVASGTVAYYRGWADDYKRTVEAVNEAVEALLVKSKNPVKTN